MRFGHCLGNYCRCGNLNTACGTRTSSMLQLDEEDGCSRRSGFKSLMICTTYTLLINISRDQVPQHPQKAGLLAMNTNVPTVNNGSYSFSREVNTLRQCIDVQWGLQERYYGLNGVSSVSHHAIGRKKACHTVDIPRQRQREPLGTCPHFYQLKKRDAAWTHQVRQTCQLLSDDDRGCAQNGH